MKRTTLIRLSALLGTGRWYFPNQSTDDYGTQKQPAYRGIKKPVLDCVAATYRLLQTTQPGDHAKSELTKIQRQFVSHIQIVLDPRKRELEIKKVITEFEVSEKLRDAP